MKKILLFIFFSCLIYSQEKENSSENNFISDVDYCIGSIIEINDYLNNLISIDPVEVSIKTSSDKLIYGNNIQVSLERSSRAKIKIPINFLDNDEICILYAKISCRDIKGNSREINHKWKIKPKYPILTPILYDTLYCGTRASFSFAALGLDEDSLYSYQIIDENGNLIADGNKHIVVLDNLLNDESYFKKELTIKGFYHGNEFRYKNSSKENIVGNSEWKVKIVGPGREHLACVPSFKKYDGEDALYLPFTYKVGERPYIPNINENLISVFNETQQKKLIFGRDFFLIGYTIIIKSPENYLGKLIVEFNDQYNEIKKPFEIKL